MTPTRSNRRAVTPLTTAPAWIGLWLLVATPAANADTLLRMTSDPGDYIGQGQSYLFGPADGTFSGSAYGDGSAHIYFSGSHDYWYLDFARSLNQPLVPGSYLLAVRYPFESIHSNGLSVWGDGRGCNQVRGSFQIRRAQYGPGNTLVALWATFEQHCEGMTPALRGEIRFNADTGLYVSPPADVWAARGAPVAFQVLAADTRGYPVQLSASGLPPGASFVDNGGGSGLFSWPSGLPDTATVMVSFMATNNQGDAQASSATIHIYGPELLSMHSQPGDFIGFGLDYLFDGSNASFTVQRNSQNGVSFNVTSGDQWWYLDFAAAGGAPLTVGTYPGATRYPFNYPDTPGLSVTGNGSGCNTVTGKFAVSQAEYAANGDVQVFWATFEQHCDGGIPALQGEIHYGGSAGPVPVLLSLVDSRTGPGRAVLVWDGSDAPLSVMVERRAEATGWQLMGPPTRENVDRLVYEDLDVTPGARYAYRLRYRLADGDHVTAEVWLDIPGAPVLSLEGFRPNPAVGELMVSFTLPDARPAALELLDLGGRQLAAGEVGSLGAGHHVARLGERAGVPPGVYWIRMRQGGQALVARGVVVH